MEPFDRILRLEEVKHRTGLGRTCIYNWIKEGRFPRQINLGARAVGWSDHEINAWIEERKNASRVGEECEKIKAC
jgi:prophage regulatory protein